MPQQKLDLLKLSARGAARGGLWKPRQRAQPANASARPSRVAAVVPVATPSSPP